MQGYREAAVAYSATLGRPPRRLPAPHQQQAVRLAKQQPEETAEATSLGLLLSQHKRAEAISLEQRPQRPPLRAICSERHPLRQQLPQPHKLRHPRLALLGQVVCLVLLSLRRLVHLLRLVVCSVVLGLLKVRQQNQHFPWLLPLQPVLLLQTRPSRHHLTCLVNKLRRRQLNQARPPTFSVAPPVRNRHLLLVCSAMPPAQAHRQRLPNRLLATCSELPLPQPPPQPLAAATRPLAATCSEPRSQRRLQRPLRVEHLALLLQLPHNHLLLLLQLPPLLTCLAQSRRIRQAQPAPQHLRPQRQQIRLEPQPREASQPVVYSVAVVLLLLLLLLLPLPLPQLRLPRLLRLAACLVPLPRHLLHQLPPRYRPLVEDCLVPQSPPRPPQAPQLPPPPGPQPLPAHQLLACLAPSPQYPRLITRRTEPQLQVAIQPHPPPT